MHTGPERRPHADHPSLVEHLLRPFLDLEPCPRGPLHARGLEHYWAAFADARHPKFSLQRTLPWPFRAEFLREVGRPEHDVEDPRQVPPPLRSERWSGLCEGVDWWPRLTGDQRCRLSALLHALCFYPLILRLMPGGPPVSADGDPESDELAYWRASSQYVLHLPGRVTEYADADLTDFERIATATPTDRPVALNAALKVLVHRAKTRAPVDVLIEWRDRARRIAEAVATKVDAFTGPLLLSRFHRAAAFVPQREGNADEVVRTMDVAERFANSLRPRDEAEELLRLENLHPVLESRTKEALWLGDLDLALSRALQVVGLDPYDSKAWLELGQVRLRRKEPAEAAEAYVAAATLGPPASATARHMAGLCFRDLGKPLLASFFFKAALEVDPRAISPHDEIHALPNTPVTAALKEWSFHTFEF